MSDDDDVEIPDLNEPLPFEVYFPAANLAAYEQAGDDRAIRDVAFDARNLLTTSTQALMRAYVSVGDRRDAYVANKERWDGSFSEQERAELSDLEENCRAKACSQLGLPAGSDLRLYRDLRNVQIEAERFAQRMMWAVGRVPLAFTHARVDNANRAFVFALDDIRLAMRKLRTLSVATEPVKKAIDELLDDFEYVWHVRDSLRHFEDRALGFQKNGDDVVWNNPAEVGMRVGSVVRSMMMMTTPNGFSITTGDGDNPHVDVTIRNVVAMRDALQAVVNAFEWDPDRWGAHWDPR